MGKLFAKGRKGLVKLLEWAVMFVTGFLVIDVMWQVFTRYNPLMHPSKWTEELARMLLIWVSLMGASLAFERKGHLGVDYFEELSVKLRGSLENMRELGIAREELREIGSTFNLQEVKFKK